MGEQKLKIIHEKCDPKLAEDRKLPYTAYLIEYVDKENGEDKTFYDITISQKAVEMFDYYYDKYKTGLKGWKQTMGIVNPKLWNPESEKKTTANKPSQRKRK